MAGKEAATNSSFIEKGLKLPDTGTSYEQLMDLAVNAILGANPKGSDLVSHLYKNAVGSKAP